MSTICDWCDGKRFERVADAAGDMDEQPCRKCNTHFVSSGAVAPSTNTPADQIGWTWSRRYNRRPRNIQGVWAWCPMWSARLRLSQGVADALTFAIPNELFELFDEMFFTSEQEAVRALGVACSKALRQGVFIEGLPWA